MFNKPFYDRLRQWRNLRHSVEISETPFEDVLNFWSQAPISRPCTDPYDSEHWPDPWELIHQNIYCEFLQILAICYTLQLTERFSLSEFEIHITLDKKHDAIVYLLFVDNQAIGYYNDGCIDSDNLSQLVCQMHHTVTLCDNI